MKRILVCFVLLLVVLPELHAQHTYKRKLMPLVELNGVYKLGGWHFAPGASYTFSRFKNRSEELYNANDTAYNATFDPGGRLGLYLEVGRYRIFEYGTLFNYMDYSLAFKQIRGKEKFEGEMTRESNSTTIATNSGDGKYGHSYITGNFNLNNILRINDYEFIQNSIGVNADYRIIDNASYNGNTAFQDQANPAKFMFQLHYKLGYGFKWTDKLFVIPMLETPILSVMTWANGRSSYEMFSSRYRPVFLTIRFAFLSKNKSNDCPTGIGHPDDKRKQQQYQQER